MKEGFRQSMAWLHTWSGLLVGWVLFMVFATGTASYFRDEITLWMKPELHAAASVPATQETAIANAQRVLEHKAAGGRRWYVTMPSERDPTVRASWVPAPKPQPGADGQAGARKEEPKRGQRQFGSAVLDPASGQELGKARATQGGDFFFRLHFDLHYMPAIWGRWIVGCCAMFMLVAILSGIVTHKRIFKDFFTFRPGKGQRSWLDAHNVSAVLALPYHLMITYTGLVTLMFLYLPGGVQAVYQDRTDAFYADLNGGPAGNAKPSGERAPLAPLAPMLAQASAAWHGAPVGRVTVNLAGDARATVTVVQGEGHGIGNDLPTMTFDGVSGTLQSRTGENGAAVATRGVMVGLHVGRFADPLLRALFFLSGLAGCVMVATGLLMWAVKERPKLAKLRKQGEAGFASGVGLRLVDGLNLGAVAGLPLAMAAFFWANRLLPNAVAQRADAEIGWFFAVWGVAALAALLLPRRWMWQLQLGLGGLLFALLPLLNAATGGAGLARSIGMGLWAVAGFDLVTLLLGLALVAAALRLRRTPARAVRLAGSAA
ncbi:PepSY domain-containing protein [Massilia forsythiae]|uniref:PepSY domain-containing protein n=1 Tax=Massilia forsythiae TaxID=2728020 RepID=A0A7Z2VZ67_9BURK|nr:PepSY-associated TM helix domain-containing protein [Massilia forsythiae]QJE02123.1 PepSY domain-containing protein [Massilia forsythiae]